MNKLERTVPVAVCRSVFLTTWHCILSHASCCFIWRYNYRQFNNEAWISFDKIRYDSICCNFKNTYVQPKRIAISCLSLRKAETKTKNKWKSWFSTTHYNITLYLCMSNTDVF